MHDLGGIIWIILVLIGVIQSIRKNAQKAKAGAAAQPAPPPLPSVTSDAERRVQVQRVVQTLQAPLVASPTPVALPPLPDHIAPVRVGTSPIRGMFGGTATLVRAIVAAEVLGPPKALQEQTIWSPRHSEPSI
jgi:hypothetical protein